MTDNPQGTIDQLDFDALINADQASGSKVSIYIPTKVSGGQDKLAAGLMRDQLGGAKADLESAGLSASEAAAIVQPVQKALDDPGFWLHMSRGLAVFAADGFYRIIRIPLEVPALRTVDDHFNVVPLAPMLEQAGRVYVLALAKNSVRLFDASRNHIEQLPLGSIPENFDATVTELPEHNLQYRSAGGERTGFYGTGGGGDTEDHLRENFLRRVGEGVAAELGTARSQPLVLASVQEYLSPFKSLCPYPNIQDVVIAGNPEQTRPEELRSKAWEVLNDKMQADEASVVEHARSLIASGKGSYDLGEIVQAAAEGRVDTLFTPRDIQRLAATNAYGPASRAILATVANKGTVRTVGEFPESSEAVATFRY